MPIYEYECGGCSRRVSLLIRSLVSAETLRCPRCGSADLSRLMSRFATPKSEEARLEAAADPSQFGDLDENDPQAVARFVKRMGDATGEDLGDELGEAMEAAAGEEGGLDGFGEGAGEADLGEDGGGDEG